MGLKESGLRGLLRSTSSVLPAFFDVTITNTNSPVQEGDILTVDYSADNTGDAQDTQDIRLEIDSVQEDVDPGVMLGGGASTTGTLEWDTTGEVETTYSATVLSDDDSDSVTVEIEPEIPDSAVYHWPFREGTGDVASEEINSQDGSISGLEWVSGDFTGGFALSGDGSGTVVTTTLQDYGSQLETDWAVLFTVEMTDGDENSLISQINDGFASQDFRVSTANIGDSGELELRSRDDSGDVFSILADERIDDGVRRRVVFNKSGTFSDIEIWFNGSEVSTTINDDRSSDSYIDFDEPLEFFADNTAGVIDNPIFTDESLTATEISDDYDAQPWS